jgi:putative N6-adenine-specific DNA methylase
MEKKAQFYIIFPVGLSELGVIELKTKWPMCFPDSELKILDVDSGGVLIEVPILLGFLLNNLLKTPTRIIMRIAEFKARDFPKLYQKASKLPWNEWLMGQLPAVEVAAHESRLFDSRKIEKAMHDGIEEFYRKQPVKKRYQEAIAKAEGELPKIYYRAVDDTVTLSLDTTGERLHKRGEKLLTGLAPIRENLASLLQIALTSDLDKKSSRELIDPMCGSGTFLLEAKNYYRPALVRKFAYEYIPDWFDSQFKKQLLAKLSFESTPLFDKFIGNEFNENVVSLAQENLNDSSIEIIQGDAFTFKKEPTCNERFIILNPPYGIRVGSKSEINSDYYKKLVNSLVENLKPKRLGIIVPEEYEFNHRNIKSMRAFKNGGIEVVFYVLEFK